VSYRDELEAAQLRINTLEAQLVEREATLRTRDAEIAERDAMIDAQQRGPRGVSAMGRLGWRVTGGVVTAACVGAIAVALAWNTQRAADEARYLATQETIRALEQRIEQLEKENVVLEADNAQLSAPRQQPTSRRERRDGEFDRDAAREALSHASADAASCRRTGGPTGRGQVTTIFEPDGRVSRAKVGPPFAGTTVGACVANTFKKAWVPAFEGPRVTVSKSFFLKDDSDPFMYR
jgi:type II secretory pathway pseudopilin PulG